MEGFLKSTLNSLKKCIFHPNRSELPSFPWFYFVSWSSRYKQWILFSFHLLQPLFWRHFFRSPYQLCPINMRRKFPIEWYYRMITKLWRKKLIFLLKIIRLVKPGTADGVRGWRFSIDSPVPNNRVYGLSFTGIVVEFIPHSLFDALYVTSGGGVLLLLLLDGFGYQVLPVVFDFFLNFVLIWFFPDEVSFDA